MASKLTNIESDEIWLTPELSDIWRRNSRAEPEPAEIEQFQELWLQAQDELYCWPVRDAATLLLGSLDDDTFLAVQDWIMSYGWQRMQRIRDHPNSLVNWHPIGTTLASTGSAACRWRHTSP